MENLTNQIHILTLVIKRQRDIPLVRSKAKLLATISGFPKIKTVQVALMASEIARFLLNRAKGGRVTFYIVCAINQDSYQAKSSGLMMHFLGKGRCSFSSDETSRGKRDFNSMISAMKNLTDKLEVKECGEHHGFELKLTILGGQKSCEDLIEQHDEIKRQLFKDIQESYLENLRAKHEEVLSLLKTLSIKNQELDKVNAELLELSKDMESLVHERTVVEFALRIADKVRNPATVIGGLARILLKKLPEDFPEQDKIEAIYLEAQKLEGIVKDFEGLAKEQERFFTEITLQELVSEILDAWRPNLEKKNITLRIRFEETPIKIKGNPQTLKVAILHILKNAVDASPKGAEIEVVVERRNGKPVIEIRDRGPGISSQIKAKLFKELVTTKPSGTGVGLIMVHHIMKEHQGEVEIESSPGQGTVVSLVFPERWKEKRS